MKHKPDYAATWYNLGIEGGGTVSARKHKPDYAATWYNLGIEGGGTVSARMVVSRICAKNAVAAVSARIVVTESVQRMR